MLLNPNCLTSIVYTFSGLITRPQKGHLTSKHQARMFKEFLIMQRKQESGSLLEPGKFIWFTNQNSCSQSQNLPSEVSPTSFSKKEVFADSPIIQTILQR